VGFVSKFLVKFDGSHRIVFASWSTIIFARLLCALPPIFIYLHYTGSFNSSTIFSSQDTIFWISTYATVSSILNLVRFYHTAIRPASAIQSLFLVCLLQSFPRRASAVSGLLSVFKSGQYRTVFVVASTF
jgi:hypothetical protein